MKKLFKHAPRKKPCRKQKTSLFQLAPRGSQTKPKG